MVFEGSFCNFSSWCHEFHIQVPSILYKWMAIDSFVCVKMPVCYLFILITIPSWLLFCQQKWSKGKVRDKLNNLILFDKPTYDKLYKEVPSYKLITPSVVSERLKVRGSLAKQALRELHSKGLFLFVFFFSLWSWHLSSSWGWSVLTLSNPVMKINRQFATEPGLFYHNRFKFFLLSSFWSQTYHGSCSVFS